MPAKVTVNRQVNDPIMQNRVNNLRGTIENIFNYQTTVSRLGRTEGVDPRRNIGDECGHPATEEILLEDYQDLYTRNPIAKKANDLLPNHSWQVQPRVVEDEDPDKETDFETKVTELGKNLSGESHYKQDQGNPFWEYLYRADKAAGIGHYGAILLGVAGAEGKDLLKPLSQGKNRELIYMRVFPEQLARVKQYDSSSNSRRYRLPEVYQLQMDDTETMRVSTDSSVHPSQGTVDAHWSRVIHITDELLSNEVFHTPRLRPSFNRYLDLDKLYGGSAEMYWKGAFPGFHFGTHPSLGGDVEVDESSMKSMVEEWLNGLQRSIITSGFSVDSLSPQVVDPTPQINIALEAICIEKDCPKRIFMGSERGELASSQDSGHWNDVVESRRQNLLTPRLIVPVIDRLIWLGVLPVPSRGFGVDWPEAETLSPLDKANVALLLTQAIAAFIQGDGEMVMPLASFLTIILGFTNKEAKAIMEALEAEEAEDTIRQKVDTIDEERHEEQGVRRLQAEQKINPPEPKGKPKF